MILTAVSSTRLEKAASDNGFDLELPPAGDWLSFATSQTTLHVWLTAAAGAGFLVGISRTDVLQALSNLGTEHTAAAPSGAAGIRHVSDIPAVHRLLRRAFQLARTLPDELLHDFDKATSRLPRTTEAERWVIQRVGQDIFRRGLLEYWEGRCAITGLAIPELLRASHIKPWADCAIDAERLDVYNGLLLAAHLDAAFDAGLITIAEDASVRPSGSLSAEARALLGIDKPLKVRDLRESHQAYLAWHRKRVFRDNLGS